MIRNVIIFLYFGFCVGLPTVSMFGCSPFSFEQDLSLAVQHLSLLHEESSNKVVGTTCMCYVYVHMHCL